MYIVAIHAALASALFTPEMFTRVRQRLGLDHERSKFLAEADARHRKQILLASEGDVVFLGDSITHALPHGLVVDRAVNFGIPGESTTELLERMDNYRSALQSARIVSLEIGINDFISGTSRGMRARYQNILSGIPIDKPLVISAVMPVRIGPRMHFTLADVRLGNEALKTLCFARRHCTFLDTWQVLATSSMMPIPEYFDMDGVHLNAAGYTRWMSQLKVALRHDAGA